MMKETYPVPFVGAVFDVVDPYQYAVRLAVALWEKHYKTQAPDWKPLPDLIGVLTQIDNMTTGLTILNKTLEECAKLCDSLRRKDYSTENDDWVAGTSDCAEAIRALVRLDFSTAGTSPIDETRAAIRDQRS